MFKLQVIVPYIFSLLLLTSSAYAESAESKNEGSVKGHGEVASEAMPQGSEKDVEKNVKDAAPNTDPFCDAIADPAREQRYLHKLKELQQLLASVNERVNDLEKQKAAYEGWVRRREEFASLATKNLVEIYATMKPEASAVRLTELNPELAASLLLAITPRQASGILNEMDEKIAASLTSIMAASARKKDPT